MTPIGIRWTIGDVSDQGFEALRCSIWGARRLFGSSAAYTVCVNTIGVAAARARTGDVPDGVVWRENDREVPRFLRDALDAGMAEGVAWKLAPLRLYPDRHEIALDNDCILWDVPAGMRAFLELAEPSCLVAEDVRPCFGRFAALCGPEPRNSGIRGVPPGFDLEAALGRILAEHPGPLTSELDEQGLQIAALTTAAPTHVVRVDEVTICSPFPPHRRDLGRCGAHFVGLNAKRLPWDYYGRPASECTREHWAGLRAAVHGRVGLEPPGRGERQWRAGPSAAVPG